MIQHIIGALLTALVAFHGTFNIGFRWLVRHFRQSYRQRALLVVTSAAVLALNIWCLFLPPASLASDIVTAITLVYLACVAATFYRPISTRNHHTQPTVLAIGAHPDDLELACGGTLAKLVDQGHSIHALVMSHGQVGGDKAARPSEAQAGGRYLGVTSTEVLDLPDTFLADHNMDMVQAIEAKVKELNPELILTHSANDHHQDHHAVHLATVRACRRHESILCFESPSTTRDFNPSVFIDIKKYVDIKIQAVYLHRNQSGKPYMAADRVRGIAAFRGSQAKREYAEGFEPVRLLTATRDV